MSEEREEGDIKFSLFIILFVILLLLLIPQCVYYIRMLGELGY